MPFFSKPSVAIGDRFVKIGTYCAPVWTVSRIRTDSVPAHVHLEKEGTSRDTITLSIPALMDGHLFARVGA